MGRANALCVTVHRWGTARGNRSRRVLAASRGEGLNFGFSHFLGGGGRGRLARWSKPKVNRVVNVVSLL